MTPEEREKKTLQKIEEKVQEKIDKIAQEEIEKMARQEIEEERERVNNCKTGTNFEENPQFAK